MSEETSERLARAHDEAQVFADELLASGDPRGELMLLELEAERATTPARCRRFNTEAQRWRELHPALAWPPQLGATHVTLRGGFAIDASFTELHESELPAAQLRQLRSLRVRQDALGSEALAAFAQTQLDGAQLERLSGVAPPARNWGATQPAFDLRRLVDGSCGRLLATLEDLRLAQLAVDHVEALACLPKLRALDISKAPVARAQLEPLACLGLRELLWEPLDQDAGTLAGLGPSLERLELFRVDRPALEVPGLHHLSLMREEPRGGLVELLAGCSRLDSLDLYYIDEPELEALPASRLRALVIWELDYAETIEPEQLRGIESLAWECGVDLELMSRLPELCRLSLSHERNRGRLRLGPKLRALTAFASAEIEHTPDTALRELSCNLAGWRSVPAAALEQLERLTFLHTKGEDLTQLGQLEQLCPKLRHFEERGSLARPWDGHGPLLSTLARCGSLRSCRFGPWFQVHEREAVAAMLPGVSCSSNAVARSELARTWPRPTARG